MLPDWHASSYVIPISAHLTSLGISTGATPEAIILLLFYSALLKFFSHYSFNYAYYSVEHSSSGTERATKHITDTLIIRHNI